MSPAAKSTKSPPSDIHIFPIVAHLKGLRQCGNNQHEFFCPCHDDGESKGKRSAHLSVGEKGLTIHCKAGCETYQICKALGFTLSDLYWPVSKSAYSSYQTNGKSSPSSTIPPKITATYEYRDESSIILYRVLRLEPGRNGEAKSFSQQRPDPENPDRWVSSIKGVRRVLYRLPELIASPVGPNSPPVFIVEGEKDVDNLTKPQTNGGRFVATTNSGGATKWNKDFNRFFKDRNVVIIPDNDPPGREHVESIASQLTGIAHSVKILDLPGLPDKGDFSDWIKLDPSHTPAKLLELVESCEPFDAEKFQSEKSEKSNLSNLKPNEADDDPHKLAFLFLEKKYSHAHAHTSDSRTGDTQSSTHTLRYYQESYFRWQNSHYAQLKTAELKSEITKFIKSELTRTHLEQLARGNLTSSPIVKKVTTSLVSNTLNAINGETMVSSDNQLPFWIDNRYPSDDPKLFVSLSNGILPLGKMLADHESDYDLIPHTPLFFSQVKLPYPFDLTATCPRWLAFLSHNLEGDQERINLIQEWFGYNLIPDTSYQKFLVLEGEGANGKSVICAALTAMLGIENVTHIGLELFGQRFQLTPTLGKLANITGDVGELDKASEGFLKSFTSGDRMQFERKGVQDQIEAEPTARLTMAMNNRPRFSDKSEGLWRRMMLVPMRIQIPAHERIKGMDKVQFWNASQELSGIFNWALTGLARLTQQQSFTEPEICLAALGQYRDEMNPVREWLRENFEVNHDSECPCKAVYDRYKKWCTENGLHPMNSRTFGKEIHREFPQIDRRRGGGKGERFWYYKNLRSLFEENEDEPSLYGDFFK